jgi:hypothetical protein
MNRFALLAAKFGDKAAAREIFAQIEDHWDPEVWGDRQTFEKAKLWAENQLVRKQIGVQRSWLMASLARSVRSTS